MPVTQEEDDAYGKFVTKIAYDLGVFDLPDQAILWHYTDGKGLLGILQSGHINATQVSALNDSKEIKLATDIYREAIEKLAVKHNGERDMVQFFGAVLKMVRDEPESVAQGTSKFFVACFSAAKDDLNQWNKYAGSEWGEYAIGFYPNALSRESNSFLHKMIYDQHDLENAVNQIAEAMVRFFKEGLNSSRSAGRDLWAQEFFAAWDEWIYKLAPAAKAATWKSEHEYRIIHELRAADIPKVKFRQKKTMLSRYIEPDFPDWAKEHKPPLPIASLMIGPKGHPSLTAVSVRLLLDQMGYINVPIERSTCTWTDR